MESDYGRPYIYALQQNKFEIAEYIREKEPAEYHSEEYIQKLLETYNVDEELVKLLKSDKRTLYRKDFEGKEDGLIDTIDFLSTEMLFEYKVKRTKFLVLTQEIENYPSIILLLHPKKKKVAYYDYEQELYGEFG